MLSILSSNVHTSLIECYERSALRSTCCVDEIFHVFWPYDGVLRQDKTFTVVLGKIGKSV
jgi:hypothetical protein